VTDSKPTKPHGRAVPSLPFSDFGQLGDGLRDRMVRAFKRAPELAEVDEAKLVIVFFCRIIRDGMYETDEAYAPDATTEWDELAWFERADLHYVHKLKIIGLTDLYHTALARLHDAPHAAGTLRYLIAALARHCRTTAADLAGSDTNAISAKAS